MRNNMGKPFASIEKAIDILSLFETNHQGLLAHEISQKLGIPLSTTYKYLDIFLRKEFLSKDAQTKKIYLGLSIFKMGNRAAERFSISHIAFPYMNALSLETRETVILSAIYGMEALCIESIESPRRVILTVKKGASLPLYAGSSAKVLLAYQDESFIDAVIKKGLEKLGENTITDPEQLKKELALIREQGFTQSNSEVDPGAGSVGAPIFDHNGGIAASLTVVGPTDRILQGETREVLISMVTDIAQKISRELGHVKDLTRDTQPG